MSSQNGRRVTSAASKTLAERAFRKHLETKRSYDGVAINPSLVSVPPRDWYLHQIVAPPMGYATPDELSGSVGLALKSWLQLGVPQDSLNKRTSNIVDARDGE